tara:strand:- start:8761 stop:10611 length:1851 start_codon:yes stop_codon:yes gene_type:complete
MNIEKTFELAVENHKKNNFQIAEKFYKEILEINPSHFKSIFLLGTLSITVKNFDKAVELLHQSISIQPDHAQSHCNLGVVYKELGETEKAKSYYQKAISIKPDFADPHNNLGIIFNELDEIEKAITCYQKAIDIQPDYADAHYNLGNALHKINKHQAAITSYEKVIQINPNYTAAHYNLGNVMSVLGEFKKAVSCYEKAINSKKNHSLAYNNMMFTLLYLEEADPEICLKRAKEFRSSLKPIKDDLLIKYQFNTKPKKLRIGFVSGDLREHPVGFFLLDTLSHLKNENLELIAYSNSQIEDDINKKLRSHFNNWRVIKSKSDMDVINTVRKDGIHILIDLSGHSDQNRLPIFINRPAPVQASWISYPGTTGIPEIDYMIGDSFVTPESEAKHFAERIFRLPNMWVCFTLPDSDIEISEPPVIKNGYVTFGSFNHLSKINKKVISLWSKILKSIPKSKIFLKTKQLNDSYLKKKIIDEFKKNGVNLNSIILEGSSPRNELLKSYNKIDIALDPFPYSGGVTSLEAIWMGVPVLTKKGFRFVSHTTESINHNSGMSDWVANDENEYVKKAIQFSKDLELLTNINKNLRQKALKSPLFNSAVFAKQLNKALWEMWNNFI